jgi:hypothetical protein
LIPDNVTADVVTETEVLVTSLSIVGIDPIDPLGKPKLTAHIDGVIAN